ncbi:helix-turn-helix transcriptional regulator [Olivibacter sp. SDN3]|uniref:helix-turn-helix transcriptional regulator n=1 Tax=Olivibacter sp. SDN3 TaxID=2764720 RepID=UPI0016514829|nr:AraC family transcriptional regulator [Olivibacter sp. SDN3]QNL51644.1 helix-turn-helix transcriptional regulator [Olivibacter sp. SDN3]
MERVFRTTYIHNSQAFNICEHVYTCRQDCTQHFHTEGEGLIEISFFLNPVRLKDKINGVENEYLPNHAYIYYTPKNADVEVYLRKGNSYRNLDIYISPSFFNEWATSNISIKEFIRKVSYNQYARLFNKGIPITLEVAHLLEDMRTCKLEGISRDYFVRAKVNHLLSLLFEKAESDADRTITQTKGELGDRDKQLFEDVKNLITANAERFFTIAYLSKAFGINTFKLKKGFKELYGMGIFEYTTKIRMAKAIDLIRNTDYSLKEIAFKVGYAAPSSFCVAFKKAFGVAPGHYR